MADPAAHEQEGRQLYRMIYRDERGRFCKPPQLSPEEVSEWLLTDEGRAWLDRYVVKGTHSNHCISHQPWISIKCDTGFIDSMRWRPDDHGI